MIMLAGLLVTVSAQTVDIDVAASATYNGTVTVTGYVIPNPGSSQEVDVAVNNPSGINVLNSVVAVDGTNGAYSYSSPAGGSSAWTNGTYVVTVTWGTLTSTYKNSTTFKYGTISTTTTSTSSSSSATPTTVTTTVTSTTTQISTSTTTATTTTTQASTTTATLTMTTTSIQTSTVPTTVSTVVVSTTSVASLTWVGIGVGGVVAAVILGGLAALFARRR